MSDKLRVHPSLQDSFVPLPSDPTVPLTKEQLRAVFPHPEVWREVVEMVLKRQAIPEENPEGEALPSDKSA